MSIAIPNFGEVKYSILAGFAFTMFYATASLFTGLLADSVSRVRMLGICSIVWSLTSIGIGLSTKFWELFMMRFLLGLFESA
jgi:MFS family permease